MTRMPDPSIKNSHIDQMHIEQADIEQAAGEITALLFACLAPASVMAALWSIVNIGRSAFFFTLYAALGHAVLFGVPLFLVLRSKGWVNVATCVIAGFAIGAMPAAILSWPTQHPQFHATTAMTVDMAAGVGGWIRYIAPLMHFGLFGALGGFAFWLILRSFLAAGKSAAGV